MNTAALSQKMTRSEGGTLMMTKFGLLMPNQYEKTHEELETLNLMMECSSLNSQETMNELNFMHHLPPSQQYISRNNGGKELMHLRNCDATLYFNVKHYLSQKESHFSNFSLYPPNPHNTLHMITRPFINQHYQFPLMNPNALFYDHGSMLKSVPQIIQPTKNGNLSPMHFKILANESQSS